MAGIIVTVARKAGTSLITEAQRWAQKLALPYVDRGSIDDISAYREQQGLECILLNTTNGAKLVTPTGEMYYHPSMALLRAERILRGEKDNFVQACELSEGTKFMDCTCGLGADSAIASLVVGAAGSVTALEASLPIYFLTSWGFTHYESKFPQLDEALRRITIKHFRAEDFLANKENPGRFDCIYFDPMFHWPEENSSNMKPLRPIAYAAPLTRESVEMALRYSELVVVKERDIRFLQALGATEIKGGRYSKVKYGIIRR